MALDNAVRLGLKVAAVVAFLVAVADPLAHKAALAGQLQGLEAQIKPFIEVAEPMELAVPPRPALRPSAAYQRLKETRPRQVACARSAWPIAFGRRAQVKVEDVFRQGLIADQQSVAGLARHEGLTEALKGAT